MKLESPKIESWTERDPFADLLIPEALQASLERHRRNLAGLIANLQSAGVSDEQIEASVTVIVASYKEELLRAIRSVVSK